MRRMLRVLPRTTPSTALLHTHASMAPGCMQAQAELSAEELERALAAAAEAGLERDALAQRLAAATAQVMVMSILW